MIYEIVKDMLTVANGGSVIGVIQDMQIIDGQARITYMTRTFQEMVNWVPAEMICVA